MTIADTFHLVHIDTIFRSNHDYKVVGASIHIGTGKKLEGDFELNLRDESRVLASTIYYLFAFCVLAGLYI